MPLRVLLLALLLLRRDTAIAYYEHSVPSEYELEPHFEETPPRNVTVTVGATAFLTCIVRNLGNKSVSWIRHRDIHILTVDTYTYTSDQRFVAKYSKDLSEWTLQIKWVQKNDSGTYECQINTQPVKSFAVSLTIVDVSAGDELAQDMIPSTGDDSYHKMFADPVLAAEIIGGPDLYVDEGSTINLTCINRHTPKPPDYMFWYHNGNMINYDSERGGVSIFTEKRDVTTSHLLIRDVHKFDAGKYSCIPADADATSITVHIVAGDSSAAIHRNSGPPALKVSCALAQILFVLSTFFPYVYLS